MREIRSIVYIQSDKDELKIESIKTLLPFKPTKFWQKGDLMYNLRGPIPESNYRMSRWAYEDYSFNKETISIEEAMLPILDLFLPYKEQLQEIRKMGFETHLCIVINSDINKKPVMVLGHSCIEKLYKLGLDIDFDTYYTY